MFVCLCGIKMQTCTTVKLRKKMKNTKLEKVITNFEREGMFGLGWGTHREFQINNNILFKIMSSENRGVHCLVTLYMLHIFYEYYEYLPYLVKQLN